MPLFVLLCSIAFTSALLKPSCGCHCRYKPHLAKMQRADPSVLMPERLMVPWWHAHSHGEDCFLINSGLYSDSKLK